jgi:CRP/FNR family cyclic AMP-dependent transcriptional regulator
MSLHLERFENARIESARLRAQSAAIHESCQRIRISLLKTAASVATAFHAARGPHGLPTAHAPYNGPAAIGGSADAAHRGLIDSTHHDADFPAASPVGDWSTLADPRRRLLAEVMEAALPWISEPHREALARSMPLRNAARRSQIAADAEIRSRLYLLVSGQAKLGFVSRSGTRRLVAVLSAGDFLGAMALVPDAEASLDSSIRAYYCNAISDCVVAEIEPEQLTGYMPATQCDVAANAVNQIVGRWLHLLMWRCGVAELDVRGRLLANLTSLAMKFGVRDSRGLLLNVRLTEFDLAELIGASRPKVSTCLSKLEREGLVKRDRRRLILASEAIDNNSLASAEG